MILKGAIKKVIVTHCSSNTDKEIILGVCDYLKSIETPEMSTERGREIMANLKRGLDNFSLKLSQSIDTL